VHEQQVPVIWARSLHTSNPLHILQMGLETTWMWSETLAAQKNSRSAAAAT
jgi:hypothetical protein